MSAYNPYAPPAPPAYPAGPPAHAFPIIAALEEPRRRLHEHLALPANVAADRALARRFGFFSILLGAGFVLLVLSAPAFVKAENALYVVVGAVVIGSILALTFFGVRARAAHTTPDVAIRSYYAAQRSGNDRFALACLAPTAREAMVPAPVIERLPIPVRSFSVASPHGMGELAKTYARAGHGQTRFMRNKRITVRDVQGDVAYVEVEAIFEAYPIWANGISIVAFVGLRAIGAVLGLVFYYALRKRARVAFVKTLLRGTDGLWYLVDAKLFEQAPRTL